MALLIHVYDPTDRPADQVYTWEALAQLDRGLRYPTVHVRTMGQTGYAKALEHYWLIPGDLVICEQDIVPGLSRFNELVACEQPFCAFDYNLSHGVPWSSCEGSVGFGLSKISEGARRAVRATPKVPQTGHRDMPGLLSERLPTVHVHYPLVEHYHGRA